jgi:hypothetical protein
MNGLEYIVTGARIPAKPRAEDLVKAARAHKPAIDRLVQQQLREKHAAVRRSQRDHDPMDLPTGRSGFRRRGGY